MTFSSIDEQSFSFFVHLDPLRMFGIGKIRCVRRFDVRRPVTSGHLPSRWWNGFPGKE
jgi:hypothetical protein